MSVSGAASRLSPPRGALWFGLFGAAAAWSLQELVSYATVTSGCSRSWEPAARMTVSGVAIVAGLAALLTAHRLWQRTRQGKVDRGRVRFMAVAGLVSSGIFLFNIVLNTAVLFLVPGCTRVSP